MNKQKHIIIFSHGFGVKKDDMGLLTDIADSLPEFTSILFDYFDVNEQEKFLTVKPFSEQVRKFTDVYNKARIDFPDATIDIIGHSQGSIIVALAFLAGARKTILLTPPFDMNIEKSLKRYSTKPDCEINFEGMSKLYRVEGYLRFIPKEYWVERSSLKSPVDLFNQYSVETELTIVNANQDTILGEANISGLNSNIKVISLDGDHGFSGTHRPALKELVRQILCS